MNINQENSTHTNLVSRIREFNNNYETHINDLEDTKTERELFSSWFVRYAQFVYSFEN